MNDRNQEMADSVNDESRSVARVSSRTIRGLMTSSVAGAILAGGTVSGLLMRIEASQNWAYAVGFVLMMCLLYPAFSALGEIRKQHSTPTFFRWASIWIIFGGVGFVLGLPFVVRLLDRLI